MKYPRTPHLPFSPGVTKDDRIISNAGLNYLFNCPVIITEKVDGSNICLSANGIHARSVNGEPRHKSFDLLKAMWASKIHRFNALCWDNTYIYGEWCYAKHSIKYNRLPGYLLIFGVRQSYTWWKWEQVEELARELDIPTVPMIGSNVFIRPNGERFTTYLTSSYLEEMFRQAIINGSLLGGEHIEGFVIRNYYAFDNRDFEMNIAKWVRKDHVQTDVHWTNQKIIKNELGGKTMKTNETDELLKSLTMYQRFLAYKWGMEHVAETRAYLFTIEQIEKLLKEDGWMEIAPLWARIILKG